ncbi:hypothetical protein H4I96_05743 [Botrytis cinerea]
MGEREIGGVLNEHCVRVQKAEDIAIEVGIGKDNSINEVVVEKADRQWLDVDDTVKPNKMEVRPFRENHFSAKDFLMMKGIDIVFFAR